MLPTGTPIFVLREGTERTTGKSAQQNNIEAAVAIADALRSTLGPRGLDKMLVDDLGDCVITNDGATILSKMDLQHPAAKMLAEVAVAQDQVAGDGTKTAVILAGELLRRAQELLESHVHPSVINQGYMHAAQRAVEVLLLLSRPVEPGDTGVLEQIAATSMASKLAAGQRGPLSKLCARAVADVAGVRGQARVVDLDDIAVLKRPGSAVAESELVEGVVLEKEPVHSAMPRTVERPRIAVSGAALAVKKTEVEARIEIRSPGALAGFLDEEERGLWRLVDHVTRSGATVLVCQKEIDERAGERLAAAGIAAFCRVAPKDLERLAKACGATIVTRWDDLDAAALGAAERLEVRKVGGEWLSFVRGCAGAKAVTVLVRGGAAHVVDEIERSLHDALSAVKGVVEEGRMLPGGGAAHIEVSLRLGRYAASVGGREQLAVEAFADAFEVIPRTLAENEGLDPIDTLIALRKAHAEGALAVGVSLGQRGAADMWKEGVVEPLRVARQATLSATEAAVMILRIDDVIAAKAKGEAHERPARGGLAAEG